MTIEGFCAVLEESNDYLNSNSSLNISSSFFILSYCVDLVLPIFLPKFIKTFHFFVTHYSLLWAFVPVIINE